MSKRTIKFYRKNEEEIMQDLGLQPTKNSGAGWIEKEDGFNEYLLAQLKSTDSESISVKLLDLEKLEYNAIVSHKIPVFVLQFIKSGEVYIMAKPADLPSVAKYLECGKCDIVKHELPELKPIKSEHKPAIKSSSKGRKKFHKEREAKWQK